MKNIKGAFTLIELLVVITIIGILATGAVATYTSQIQKARDTTRVSDLEAFKGGLEQAYSDLSFYPGVNNVSAPSCNNTSTNANLKCLGKMGYLAKLPKDPKAKGAGNGSALEYTYAVGPSDNVLKQVYEISLGVESDSQKLKAGSGADNGNDDNRYEIGHVRIGINTKTNGNSTVLPAPLSLTISNSVSNAMSLTNGSCSLAGGVAPATSNDTSNNQSSVAIIRGNCNF